MRSPKINTLAVSTAALFGLAAPLPVLAQDAGAKAFAETCSACHTAKVRPLDKKRMSKDQWKQAIDKMTNMGAEIPKEKVPQILDYLARTHGPDSK
jgi:mono/diheme cytochrome c family protein